MTSPAAISAYNSCSASSYYFALGSAIEPVFYDKSATVWVEGGVPPYYWALTEDISYPSAIALVSATTQTKQYNTAYAKIQYGEEVYFPITVTDSCGNEASGTLFLCRWLPGDRVFLCGQGTSNEDTIQFDSDQMWGEETQTLSVASGESRLWRISSGGGSLSDTTGTSVEYTSVTNNSGCADSPTIEVGCSHFLTGEFVIMDTLFIAVSTYPTSGVVAMLGSAEEMCPCEDPSAHCTAYEGYNQFAIPSLFLSTYDCFGILLNESIQSCGGSSGAGPSISCEDVELDYAGGPLNQIDPCSGNCEYGIGGDCTWCQRACYGCASGLGTTLGDWIDGGSILEDDIMSGYSYYGCNPYYIQDYNAYGYTKPRALSDVRSELMKQRGCCPRGLGSARALASW